MNGKECCIKCKFFAPQEDPLEISHGYCRRHPPRIIYDRNEEMIISRFPLAMADDWCGEFEHLPEQAGVADSGEPLVANLGPLSSRARNCLRSEGIRTITQLVSKSASDLLEIRNLGEGTLNEIVASLSARGLELAY
jgi:hypothetical protein